jgi:hypothetical protein
MNTPPSSSTIQITSTNLELLDSVGRAMQQRFPHLWGDEIPTRNTIVGFLANEFLSDDSTASPSLRPVTEPARRPGDDLRSQGDNAQPPLAAERGEVYALRGRDGRLRGRWHVTGYAECPGRAAFAVQHPDDEYSLVGFDEVVRRRLKQCAFCSRYERGEL